MHVWCLIFSVVVDSMGCSFLKFGFNWSQKEIFTSKIWSGVCTYDVGKVCENSFQSKMREEFESRIVWACKKRLYIKNICRHFWTLPICVHSKTFVVFRTKALVAQNRNVLINILNIGLWIAYSRVLRVKNQEKTEKYQ